MREFIEQFRFQPEFHGWIGVEREGFLMRNGTIVPIAPEVIPQINHPQVGNEFSACQIEDRVGPCQLPDLRRELQAMDATLAQWERRLCFTRNLSELAPDDMPLDCYPDEKGRYQELRNRLTPRQLLAAHQVAGTHIHVGMADAEQALIAYNRAVPHWQHLCKLGDHSGGRRLELYPLVAPDYIPPPYISWEDVYDYACTAGWAESPRSCYHLIRISVHGTIEFRMFGATPCHNEILEWATECHRLCLT